MPKIIDNQSLRLTDELRATLDTSKRADFCVGYFNLRGWQQLADLIENLPGDTVLETEKGDATGKHRICRLLVGMHKAPDDLLRDFSMNQSPFQTNKRPVYASKWRWNSADNLPSAIQLPAMKFI